ncbi:hypothetical protein [Streptomyces goshikiensis]
MNVVFGWLLVGRPARQPRIRRPAASYSLVVVRPLGSVAFRVSPRRPSSVLVVVKPLGVVMVIWVGWAPVSGV